MIGGLGEDGRGVSLRAKVDSLRERLARSALESPSLSREKLRMAVDAAGIGFWSWEPATDTVVWEDAMCAIFGLAPGSAPAGRQGYLALVHADDRAHAEEGIRRGLAAGRWEDEYRIVRRDGAVRSVMAKGTVLRDEGGEEVVLGSLMDVTEQRQRDEQLRQTQKLEAVGQLTAGIAHNFNNLLMSILPNVELALEQAPPAIQPLLQEAERAAHRAAELVRQLTTYAGRNRPSEQRVECLGSLVERTVAMCRTTFDRRIGFETHYDASAHARVDPIQIEQAILNLVINARDALSDPRIDMPRVRIDIELVRAGAAELARVPLLDPAADYARIRVSDNGVGMDGETLARIYEPFFTTKPVGHGTGLGLATTRAIVREHAGTICCDSRPGAGTSFALYLPSVSRAGAAALAPEPLPTGGVETVLVVDDEEAIRDVVAFMLASAGYTVKTAPSGQGAIDVLLDPRAASSVALVLLDVSMPGIPGVELRRRLRELAPRARAFSTSPGTPSKRRRRATSSSRSRSRRRRSSARSARRSTAPRDAQAAIPSSSLKRGESSGRRRSGSQKRVVNAISSVSS